ncbi:COMM domain [Phytophthora infestans]|uniref:COMM domain n=1 Tax=Phytophthora infestans TaxID=4787 RepID=A0A833SGN0_PHYIN|nr:COMM domain [Phytophthora infestans]
MVVTSQSYAMLNVVVRDKLGQVLACVLDKMATNEVEIDTTVEVAGKSSATFGHVDRNLLLSRGVENDVVSSVEKTWRKRGRSLATRIAAFQGVETPALTLQKTDWRLHLEMGSSKRSGQSQPTAIFQLELKNTSADEVEKLDVELSHAELRTLFLQLNAIQAELDAPPTPSAA